jgi:hypothetical protein
VRDVQNAGADRIRTQTSILRLLLCQPMAPPLPLSGNGDFGTSPFFGQLRDKPLLAYQYLCRVSGLWPVSDIDNEHRTGK